MRYEKMNLKQLRAVARDYKIPGRADLGKADLIELIKSWVKDESKRIDEKISEVKPKKIPGYRLAESKILQLLDSEDLTLSQIIERLPYANHIVNKALSNLRHLKLIDFVIIDTRPCKKSTPIHKSSFLGMKPPKVRKYHKIKSRVDSVT